MKQEMSVHLQQSKLQVHISQGYYTDVLSDFLLYISPSDPIR